MKKEFSVRDCERDLSSEAGRDVRVCGVVKGQPLPKVRSRISEGLNILGINYLQEGLRLMESLESERNLRWDFVGRIQSNKIKQLVKHFELIQSLSKPKHLKMLDKEARLANKVQKVLVEVNSGREESKSGLLPEDVLPFVEHLKECQNVLALGMMTMGPRQDDADSMRPYFALTSRLFSQAAERNRTNYKPEILSMGMSSDYRVAVQSGSNLVRLGSVLFGEREPNRQQ